MPTTEERIRALTDALVKSGDYTKQELDGSIELEGDGIYGEGEGFSVCRREYSVLTDAEADSAAYAYIKESLWAFNTSFILAHSKLPAEAEEMIRSFQEKCEGANETILALIVDLDHFVEDAICADGRGHFLSSYDGEEVESGQFYIYRNN
jgi:hypothetical protein